MRLVACILVVASSLSLACGGKTPPAKDADEATSNEKSDDTSAPSGGGGGDDGGTAPTASAAPTTSEPATPPKTDSSGDLKAASGDDPWLAAHQMPAGDVLKTMKPQQGKVHACFKAGLKRDGSTNGEVKIKFVITNDGVVRVYKDNGSSMTDEEVTKCVGDLLQKLKFPKQKSPGDAWGTYSINFTP
ncbi:MAG TPA: AgmX/PglI C-terminal domain-containing protein [Polyangiaceae bacterium]|jgi:hypothetical protein